MSSLKVFFGDKVELTDGDTGYVRFIGNVKGKKSVMYGIELTKGKGKTNGTLDDILYFKIKGNKKNGRFVTKAKIKKRTKQTKSEKFTLNDEILCTKTNSTGIVKYIGIPGFSLSKDTINYGIELSKPKGNCNGGIKGYQYFTCKSKHGIYVRTSQVKPVPAGIVYILIHIEYILKYICTDIYVHVSDIYCETDKSKKAHRDDRKEDSNKPAKKKVSKDDKKSKDKVKKSKVKDDVKPKKRDSISARGNRSSTTDIKRSNKKIDSNKGGKIKRDRTSERSERIGRRDSKKGGKGSKDAKKDGKKSKKDKDSKGKKGGKKGDKKVDKKKGKKSKSVKTGDDTPAGSTVDSDALTVNTDEIHEDNDNKNDEINAPEIVNEVNEMIDEMKEMINEVNDDNNDEIKNAEANEMVKKVDDIPGSNDDGSNDGSVIIHDDSSDAVNDDNEAKDVVSEVKDDANVDKGTINDVNSEVNEINEDNTGENNESKIEATGNDNEMDSNEINDSKIDESGADETVNDEVKVDQVSKTETSGVKETEIETNELNDDETNEVTNDDSKINDTFDIPVKTEDTTEAQPTNEDTSETKTDAVDTNIEEATEVNNGDTSKNGIIKDESKEMDGLSYIKLALIKQYITIYIHIN